jgi:DNA polymerase
LNIDPVLLARHLRQQAELGGRELYLDRLEPAAVRAALAGKVQISAPTVVHDRTATPHAESLAGAASLISLGRQAAGCRLCRLHAGRTNVVFGEGDPEADVVVVGEAPGQEEDRTGRPFVGRAGKLLDLMLMSIGLPRPKVYICNVLKCRPPENRNPFMDEVEHCTTTFLHGQLESIAPRVLLAVGKFAAQVLCASEESIGRLRGRVHTYRDTPLVVSYHPAYLLRSPNMIRVAWQDLQLVRRMLDEQA